MRQHDSALAEQEFSWYISHPPVTPMELETESLHGEPITEAYRWLEDLESPRVRTWIEAQTKRARGYLDSVSCRTRLAARIRAMNSADVVEFPLVKAGRYCYRKRVAGAEYPSIFYREKEDPHGEKLLVDGARLPEGPRSIHPVGLSEDRKLLAYEAREPGRDFAALYVLNIEEDTTTRVLPAGLLRSFRFSRRNAGFFYVQETWPDYNNCRRAANYMPLEPGPGTPVEVADFGVDPDLRIYLCAMSDDESYACYLLVWRGSMERQAVYLQNRMDGSMVCIAEPRDDVRYQPILSGSQLFLRTNLGAPNGRLLMQGIEKARPDGWREIVPERPHQLNAITVTTDQIFATYVENVSSQTQIFTWAGSPCGALNYPPCGTAELPMTFVEGDEIFYRYTSFTHPPCIMRYDLNTKENVVWAKPDLPFEPSSLEVVQQEYESKDGTLVPVYLVQQKGAAAAGPHAMILTGYGGWGSSETPRFQVYIAVMAELGCRIAIAGIRGGAERGAAWYEAGRRRNKQNTIDDFIAAAEWLVRSGYTTPGRLAAAGGSNAGLVVGAALTQRPDLFCAVLCICPILDMLRYHLFGRARFWATEYGTVDNAEDFSALYKYSPYHQIRDGIEFPAVLIVSGDADERCHPMHALKAVARLQAATSSRRPILLDYKPSRGHYPAVQLSAKIDGLADRLAFLCDQLQVPA